MNRSANAFAPRSSNERLGNSDALGVDHLVEMVVNFESLSRMRRLGVRAR